MANLVGGPEATVGEKEQRKMVQFMLFYAWKGIIPVDFWINGLPVYY